MAAKRKFNVEVNEEEIANGHYVYFLFPVQELDAVQSRPFRLDYEICCGSLSTSWTLTVIYKHEEDSNEFSLALTLIRADKKINFLKVFAVAFLSCLDENKRLIRFTEQICKKLMVVGDVVQGCIKESASLLSALKVSLLVKSCHNTEDFDPNRSVSSRATQAVHCLKM